MARARTEIDELAARIKALKAVDRVNLLARVLPEPEDDDWSVLTRIQRRFRHVDARALDNAIDQAVREVRRARVRRAG